MRRNLSGSKLVITGAARGIGEKVARIAGDNHLFACEVSTHEMQHHAMLITDARCCGGMR